MNKNKSDNTTCNENENPAHIIRIGTRFTMGYIYGRRSLAEKFWNLQFVGTGFSISLFSGYLYFQKCWFSYVLGIFDTGFKNILKQFILFKNDFGMNVDLNCKSIVKINIVHISQNLYHLS